MRRQILLATTAGLALYGFAAWVYVALVALTQPATLHLQLTHLARWPRTDTFGAASFLISLISFVTYRFLAEQHQDAVERAAHASRPDP